MSPRTRTTKTTRTLGALLALTLVSSACTALPAKRRATQRADSRERIELAKTLTEQGRFEDALHELELAIAENPTLTVAHLQAGEIYKLAGNFDAAETSFRRAAYLQPDSIDTQYNLGLILQLNRDAAGAARAYNHALAIDPYHFESNLNIATTYLQLDQPLQALPFARRAVALDDTHGPARANLGATLASLGRHAEAISEYQAAAERMDLTSPLLLNLADSLGKTQRYREMATTLERLVEIDPTPQAFERLGYARFKLEQFNEAIDSFRRSLSLDATHYPALNGVGVCMLNQWILSNQQDPEILRLAIESLRNSIRINNQQPRVIDLLNRYS
ncbi:MAG: tetratricopeptide repeat protein [Phycisphaerales bacterium JB043]